MSERSTALDGLNRLSGRERDADLARKIFGPPSQHVGWWWWSSTGFPLLDEDAALFAGPHFHEKIEDAWLLVDRLRALGWMVRIEAIPYGGHRAMASRSVTSEHHGSGATAPEAICEAVRALLKASEVRADLEATDDQ